MPPRTLSDQIDYCFVRGQKGTYADEPRQKS
jgi:hypothetical protein